MKRPLHSPLPAALVVAAMTAACKDQPAPRKQSISATTTTAAAATAPPPPVPSTSAPPPSAPASDTILTARVHALLEGYRDGSSFAFLRDACAPTVERFITMKNATPEAVQTSAVGFFRDKRGVKYTAPRQAMSVTHDAAGDVVHVPLTMVWGTLPPAEWAPDAPDRRLPDSAGDVIWERLVEHTTHVDVELTFDHDGRLIRYLEGAPHRAKLKFNADEPCREIMGFAIALPDGEVVTDLGEVYAMEIMSKGPQLARHVRLRDGSDRWVQDTRSYEVGDLDTGPHAGWSNCLTPLEQTGPR